jgi:hypothetical protein
VAAWPIYGVVVGNHQSCRALKQPARDGVRHSALWRRRFAFSQYSNIRSARFFERSEDRWKVRGLSQAHLRRCIRLVVGLAVPAEGMFGSYPSQTDGVR